MAELQITPKRTIGHNHPTFIIAEIGQNHQGDVKIAKKLIHLAKESGADCVKFQKTCLTEKFNKSALDRPYRGPHSWGATYGEHKQFLEFTKEQFRELQSFAAEIGILFTASAMDSQSLRFLASLNVPFIKIGSGDSNNLLLIQEAAAMNVPLVISTGMQDLGGVRATYECVAQYHKKFALLHCVSAYPTPLQEINLNVIKLYETEFPDVVIGYSGHELGIEASVAAVAVGAKIIERHVTLDKTQKGSDHQCSLEPQELKLLIEKIRELDITLGKPVKAFQASERPCYAKLGKSLVAATTLRKGDILQHENIKIKVAEPKGIDASLLKDVIGKHVKGVINEDESILQENLE
ncbi:Sialic acid synthase-like Protein [Tribolium castaneum]|uniref:Sialic acid synthase-like Protein n=1 Tax=Tribolium castaneum TaxID=7070 RepID=D6WCA5_TRICA|nr:PREDICTED: sialic acid synthase [Tribolium castaneum]EEZ97826.1 Sialic acid synthase-like Protein [Tribolium castaneum]|eukprot:XP_008190466.1 PREDICTED: sialic acid synthase [Tribolium castaneum]